ncbi:MAG: phosphoribosylformimino-5-aminoimidazole carboxamide ribotide isomerase [Acidobacteria bacterium]|nr:phosphoribosylformimino-5-aminoimidazole carboxamide ribotide isomerase [Acidobacteriota bacterium]
MTAPSGDFQVIPAIDMKGGRCVRLEEGDASRLREYGDDPLAMALHWQEQGAERLHLVDLDGAFSGEGPHLQVAAAIFRTLRIPVQYGGGLRTLEQIGRILDLGARRAIVGTAAITDPQVLEEAVKRWRGSLAVAIDARAGVVAVRGWVDQSGVSALELAERVRMIGIERVIYTDVSRDGTFRGVNVEETETLARRSGLKVIASGGVTTADDVYELWRRRQSGIEGVILGRALYEKRLDFRHVQSQLTSWQGDAGKEDHSVP